MTAATAADRDARRVPVRGLTVLYDAECSLCAFVRDWLVGRPQLVPLELVPAGSAQARRRLPGLNHRATLDEVTVVGDAGQVYRGAAAWVVVLWALREHRPLAHRLSTPAGALLARGAVLAAARWRGGPRGTRGGRAWGGAAYPGADSWTYRPDQGWVFTPPGCGSGACATD
ncbi:thiol-disulfide oxidoreductase DCC family protein [Streptomyces tropicalis]|uniref:DCC1-like thiol-disulfide oxidoreductase family protein n=1 Tax=Streptomyces tropicalis TaxID=3034234 RepID=A0ABT6A0V7_9ACTN|nr:DCC1-like thiol-disulfide oxidoreductase family protein [Streptomyces tropicalis]MDF3298279.1 DCC1-like thiol-disulfide oxidoreductase family protein [Streptomyces tropicalis]